MFITLQSICSEENRYRGYRIDVLPVSATSGRYLVICSWGRIQRLSQRCCYWFQDNVELRTFLHQNLNTRKRHQYEIVVKSEGFPEVKALKEGFEAQRAEPQALRLEF